MDRNFWEDMRRMRKGMNQYFSYPDFSEDEDEIDEPSDYRKAWAEFSETENNFFPRNALLPSLWRQMRENSRIRNNLKQARISG